MEITNIAIDKLNPAKYNPRLDLQPNDKEYQDIKRSITEFTLVEPLVINKDMTVIGGHQRLKVLKDLQYKEVPCIVVDLDKQKEKMLNISLNKISGDWDRVKIKDLLLELDTGEFDVTLTGWGEQEIEDLMTEFHVEPEEDIERIKLVDKFIVPPFSVLDTRQGYWQDRKRAWIGLGIKSEVGREETLLGFSSSAAKFGNRRGADVNTSVFDPVISELCYKWFCIDNGKILDPFAGGSVRGIVANYLKYKYTGIDLSKGQIEANYKQAKEIIPDNIPNWIIGNSLTEIDKLDNDYDFIFSCPPYFDLEIYSDDKDDLSNLDWEEFKKQYKLIIEKAVNKLKDNRFACFVVGDIRDKKGFYRNFVSDTISAFQDAGTLLYNEAILVTAVGSLPIRIGKQFGSYRKLGKTHQNVLVFYKGDIKKIKENYKEIEIADLENYE